MSSAPVVGLFEVGVQSWEGFEQGLEPFGLATWSIVGRAERPSLAAGAELLEHVRRDFPLAFRWHTYGETIGESRARAIILSREMALPIEGFAAGVTVGPITPVTLAVVHELIPPVAELHLETLADPTSTMLVLAKDGLDAEALLEQLADAPTQLNDPWLTLALRGRLEGTLVVRAFTSLDYEACVQVYGDEQQVNGVAEIATSTLGVEQRSLEGVLDFLGR